MKIFRRDILIGIVGVIGLSVLFFWLYSKYNISLSVLKIIKGDVTEIWTEDRGTTRRETPYKILLFKLSNNDQVFNIPDKLYEGDYFEKAMQIKEGDPVKLYISPEDFDSDLELHRIIYQLEANGKVVLPISLVKYSLESRMFMVIAGICLIILVFVVAKVIRFLVRKMF
jgi:hypothetical protein